MWYDIKYYTVHCDEKSEKSVTNIFGGELLNCNYRRTGVATGADEVNILLSAVSCTKNMALDF